MKYHRVYVNGGIYFFTLVSNDRIPLFSTPEAIELLHEALRYTSLRMPFETIAFVILPDHIHFLWSMPEVSSDYSSRWRLIKSYFTRYYKEKDRFTISSSRKMKKEQGIWQRRFWEHLIRDDNDLARHVEYIHFNPKNTDM